jgi:hypothetical protein
LSIDFCAAEVSTGAATPILAIGSGVAGAGGTIGPLPCCGGAVPGAAPPVALARLAFAGLGYAGQTAKADFTERLWEAQALEALENILDDDDFEASVDDMNSNSKKAIMIEFDITDFDEAYELVKFFREQGNLGKTMINMMRAEKQKMDV